MRQVAYVLDRVVGRSARVFFPLVTAICVASLVGIPRDVAFAKAQQFGDPLGAKKALPLSKVANEMAASGKTQRKNVCVSGKVAAVCQKKGCWLELEDKSAKVRTTFKGYKFFVPFSLKGKSVKAYGDLLVEEVSVADQKHFLKDAKASPAEVAAVTKPKKSLKFVATGVEVVTR